MLRRSRTKRQRRVTTAVNQVGHDQRQVTTVVSQVGHDRNISENTSSVLH